MHTLRFLVSLGSFALAVAAAPAAAAPVTLSPGVRLVFNVDARAYAYDYIRLFADVSGAVPSAAATGSFFAQPDGTGDFFNNTQLILGGVNDFVLNEGNTPYLLDGIFSVALGPTADSASSITFDDIRLVFFTGGRTGTRVSEIALPQQLTVPEPGTAALLALAVALVGLGRPRTVASTAF